MGSEKLEIAYLCQEIFSGMPVNPGLEVVEITIHASHKEWDGISGSDIDPPIGTLYSEALRENK